MAQYLPARAAKVLRALIEVVKPKKPGFDLALEDYMLEFLDHFYSHFPFHMKIGFPAGLYLLEYGTFIFGRTPRTFSSMNMEQRTQYVKGWINSRMALRRDLIKGVKGVCLTAYYSHPEVMDHIGYSINEHMERANRGEPCDPRAAEFFRGLGYDRNSRIPWPAYDHVVVTTRDTLPAQEEGPK